MAISNLQLLMAIGQFAMTRGIYRKKIDSGVVLWGYALVWGFSGMERRAAG
jgi:hypothetical protein